MSSTDTPSTTSATATSAATASSTSTPSPSTSSTATAPQSTNRRPRKSTLTQQQKNQKRQRATHEQLVTLEMEFNKNPTPTAAVRERIAQEINMTERSVQIWFQNRRAKIKMIAKRSIETGENCDAIPESMRQYLAMQFDPNKPGARDLFGRTSGLGGYGSGGHSSESTHSGKIVIHHFTCRSLTIGTWRRVGQNAMDLVIFYSPEKATMTYYINNDSAGYKIEYPFSYIKNITLESGDQAPNPNGTPPRPAGLVVELNRPPLFYMDSSNSGGFYQCGDFTEDQQASQVMVHHLGGHPKVLSVQLAKLVSLESFQNRLAFNNYAMSAPVSPQVIDRPASQPDCLGPVNMGMYQDGAVGVNYQAIRGHKRQRSRSVPAAVDFSALQAQMPAYHVQQPSTQFTPPDSSVFAPVPQSAHPVGTNLRVDTSSVYGMDFRSYPMSAPVTASPTDFASPSFFTTGATSEPIPVVANFAPQYNVPYVSPPPMVDPSKVIPQSTSPMPDMSHADPLIADQSPPLSTMHPSTSADMFALGAEHQSNFSDDGLMLSEMYAKQNLNLSVPSPVAMNDPGFEVAMSGLPDQTSPVVTQGDYQGMMMPFETVDPTTLAGGS